MIANFGATPTGGAAGSSVHTERRMERNGLSEERQ